MNTQNEITRIKRTYRFYRGNKFIQARWDDNLPGNAFILGRREEMVKNILKKRGYLPLNCRKILDIGCGRGKILAGFTNSGAEWKNLYGVDLLPENIEEAKKLYPALDLRCADAQKLDFSDSFFDLILFFTVFSSVREESLSKNLSSEALRVLKNEGIIIIYDTRYMNPLNLHIRRVTQKQVKKYFKGCDIDFISATLIPPLARLLAPASLGLCSFVEKLPFLKSHYLAIIGKNRYGQK